MNNLNTQKTINSVDFKIEASGYGVVNWNGNTSFMVKVDEDKKTKYKIYSNYSMPKLRGFSNICKKTIDGEEKNVLLNIDEVVVKDYDMYISSNCIRHYLFKDEINFANEMNSENYIDVLKTVYGLIRGYVNAKTQDKRKSPLLIEDFVDTLKNGNFETFVNSGEKEKGNNNIFNKLTYGETKYISYGSICIEDLQFISLDKIFDRCALTTNEKDAKKLAKEIGEFITSLSKDGKVATVTYSENYVRNGTVHQTKEAGMLLDNNAISILVEETLRRIKSLYIRNKGSMRVSNVIVDYNNSAFFRIKDNEEKINTEIGDMEYTQYYTEVK